MKSFRDKLNDRELLLGTFITLPYPEIIEILAETGVDWFFIDMEHAPITVENAIRIIQTAEGLCPCLVRVPANTETWIKRILDLGPDGIIVPHIDSVEEAAQMMEWAHFPPRGIRSVGVSRTLGYDDRLLERLKSANNEILVIPQVEHISASRQIESIVALSDIQAVFVGPFDLSGSLNRLGETSHPEVQAEIEKISRACEVAGKAAGIFAADPEFALRSIKMGYRLVNMGADTLFLSQSARQAFKALRSQLSTP